MHKPLSKISVTLLFGLSVAGLTACADSPPTAEHSTAPVSEVAGSRAQQSSSAVEPTANPAATEAKQLQQEAAPATADSAPKDPLELQSFTGDFKPYQLGDIVPDLYRSAQYNLSNWQARKLPAPETGTHWTYFGGSYVLISDAEGKISRIFSGDIIYR